MTGYFPPYRPRQPSEFETGYVQLMLEHARQRQVAIEAVRRAAGGVWDPILGRYVQCEVKS